MNSWDLAHESSAAMTALMIRQSVRCGDYEAGAGLALARELERRALGVQAPAEVASQASSVDASLAGFFEIALSRRGPDVHDYLSSAMSYESERLTSRVHSCGKRLFLLALVPKLWVHGRRYLWVCERCGKVCDVSEQSVYVGMRQVDGGFALELPGAWTGRTAWLTASVQPLGGERREPVAARRLTLEPEVRVAFAPPAGELGLRRFAVALVFDGDYVISQLPYSSGD